MFSGQSPGTTLHHLLQVGARSLSVFETLVVFAIWTQCFSSSSQSQLSDTIFSASMMANQMIFKNTKVTQSMITCCISCRSWWLTWNSQKDKTTTHGSSALPSKSSMAAPPTLQSRKMLKSSSIFSSRGLRLHSRVPLVSDFCNQSLEDSHAINSFARSVASSRIDSRISTTFHLLWKTSREYTKASWLKSRARSSAIMSALAARRRWMSVGEPWLPKLQMCLSFTIRGSSLTSIPSRMTKSIITSSSLSTLTFDHTLTIT